jgi:hypothetical protein
MRPEQVVFFIRERQQNYIVYRFPCRIGARTGK